MNKTQKTEETSTLTQTQSLKRKTKNSFTDFKDWRVMGSEMKRKHRIFLKKR